MNDAHLHLQDARLDDVEKIVTAMQAASIKKCVVNGTGPSDWERVQQLADAFPEIVVPSYGLHPWKTPQPDASWQPMLEKFLAGSPAPCVGECGLDRWMQAPDKEAQEAAFLFQLKLARELNAPLSIHILRAWGWFIDLLRAHPFPERGFLLHSYNGSKELLPELLDRGAYFSFSGYYLHEQKTKQQEVFRAIPKDRLLVETDAPDMLPPSSVIAHPLGDLNHPANLPLILQGLAKLLEENPETLEKQIDQNFSDFFTV